MFPSSHEIRRYDNVTKDKISQRNSFTFYLYCLNLPRPLQKERLSGWLLCNKGHSCKIMLLAFFQSSMKISELLTASKYLLHAAAKVPAESESNVCLPQLQSVTMKIIWDFRRRQVKTFSIIILGKQTYCNFKRRVFTTLKRGKL